VVSGYATRPPTRSGGAHRPTGRYCSPSPPDLAQLPDTEAEGARDDGERMTKVIMTRGWDQRTRARRRRTQRGATAVEFAFVVPILITLVFGVIQFGFVFAQLSALSHGARQGARWGVVNLLATHTCGTVIQQVRTGAQTIAMPGDTVNVAVTGAGGSCSSSGDEPAVISGDAAASPCTNADADTPGNLTVTASFPTRIDIPPFGIGGSFTLKQSSTYRCEYK